MCAGYRDCCWGSSGLTKSVCQSAPVCRRRILLFNPLSTPLHTSPHLSTPLQSSPHLSTPFFPPSPPHDVQEADATKGREEDYDDDDEEEEEEEEGGGGGGAAGRVLPGTGLAIKGEAFTHSQVQGEGGRRRRRRPSPTHRCRGRGGGGGGGGQGGGGGEGAGGGDPTHTSSPIMNIISAVKTLCANLSLPPPWCSKRRSTSSRSPLAPLTPPPSPSPHPVIAASSAGPGPREQRPVGWCGRRQGGGR